MAQTQRKSLGVKEMAIPYDKELDVRGAKCPIPVVKARQAIKGLSVGQVLRVVATDPGSVADFKGWAKVAKDVELLAQETEEQNGQTLYVHYVKRTV